MFSPTPNWHPFLVHFTIALFFASFAFMAAARLTAGGVRSGELETAGRWALWAAAAITLLTVASGTYAYYTVAHDDPSHAAMEVHRNWALASGALVVFLGLWSYLRHRRQADQPPVLVMLMAVGVIMLGLTGLKGGGLVYEYGLGVASLPKPEGPGHSHEAGEEHPETAPTAATPEKPGHAHEPGEEHEEKATVATAEKPGHTHEAGEEHEEKATVVTPERSAAVPGSPEAVVDAFAAALAAGDEAGVRAALAADVLIYESGGAERSLEEYAGHHMGGDMAFVAAMERQLTDRKVFDFGNTAVVTSMGTTKGSFRQREMNLLGTETMLLEKRDGVWLIIHIHWSSRPAS